MSLADSTLPRILTGLEAASRLTLRGLRSAWLTALAALAVFAWALQFGGESMSPRWQDRTFYQQEMGPAVMYACGHGLRREAKDPELKSFLQLQQATLACEHTKEASANDALNGFQAAHRYLLLTLGEAWRHWGVDWRVADSLVLGLYALSCTMGFLLLRVFLPLVWSLAGTWLFASAGSHLFYLDSLRDYAKAPFVLAVLAGLAWLLKERHPPRQRLLVALLTGCALGVGLGFRMDLLIFVPFVAAMLCFFYPAPLREAWGERLLTTAVLLLAACVCAFPVLAAMAKGSNTAHVILLGLSQPFSEALRVATPDYQIAAYYHDMFQHVQIETFAALRGVDHELKMSTPEYERQGYRLLWEWAQRFPADVFLRVGAALYQGLSFPYELQIGLSGRRALLLVGVGVAVIGWRSTRLSWAFMLAVLFLFAYPALQFDLRHFFFLSLVTVLCLGLGAYALVLAPWRMFTARHRVGLGLGLRLRSLCVTGGVVLCVPVLVWVGLGLLQRPMQAELLQAARALPVLWVFEGQEASHSDAPKLFRPSIAGSWWTERFSRHPHTREDSERMGYFWVVDLDPSRQGCRGNPWQAALSYQASTSYFDLSRSVTRELHQASRIFVPVVEFRRRDKETRDWTILASLLVHEASWPCVRRIGLAEPTSAFPWLLEMALPLDTKREHLRFATPARLSPGPAQHWSVASAPAQDLSMRFDLAQGPLELLALGDSDLQSGAAATLTARGLRVDSAAAGRYTYLVRTGAIRMKSEEAIHVSGVLETGGLSVGLLKGEAWAHQLTVLRPGPFDLFFSPEAGDYQLVIANHVSMPGERNAFEVQSIGRLAAARP